MYSAKSVTFLLLIFIIYCQSRPQMRDLVPLKAPANLTIVSISGDQVKLDWEPVPPESVRGHFNGYAIRIWNHMRSLEYAVPSNVTESSVDFFPFSRNFITVSVRNNNFVGSPSQAVSFDAPQTAPMNPVRFEANQLGQNSVYLNWSRPEANGILLGYRIVANEMLDEFKVRDEVQASNQVNNPDLYETKLTGLREGRAYRITVFAANCVGESMGRYLEIQLKPHTSAAPAIPEFKIKVNYTETYILEECNREKVNAIHNNTLPPKLNELDFDDDIIVKSVAYITNNEESCIVDALVTWKPDLKSNNPGDIFYVKYKPKDEKEFKVTEPETRNLYTILKGYNSCKPYEIIVTAVDGEYNTDSDLKEVSKYKWGYHLNLNTIKE